MEILELKIKQENIYTHDSSIAEQKWERSQWIWTDQIPIRDKSNFNRNTKYESISNMYNKRKRLRQGVQII